MNGWGFERDGWIRKEKGGEGKASEGKEGSKGQIEEGMKRSRR